jgi:hypothetical protein
MKRLSICFMVLGLVYALKIGGQRTTARGQDAPPPTQNAGGNADNGNAGPPGGPGEGGPDGAGNNGGGGRPNRPPGGFHLLPRFVVSKLNLTDDQKNQIADLEKETKAKLAAILTADQMKTLETTRPPGPGGRGGPNGPGEAGGGGGQGNGGGPGGPPGGGADNSNGGPGGAAPN